jgi:hypothetical protein
VLCCAVPCCACLRVAAQIRSLRSKLKDSRSTVEQLTTELSSVQISMHEREAEMMSALRSSTERLPGSAMGTYGSNRTVPYGCVLLDMWGSALLACSCECFLIWSPRTSEPMPKQYLSDRSKCYYVGCRPFTAVYCVPCCRQSASGSQPAAGA